MAFENSEWIWSNACPSADEYAEFYCDFEVGDKNTTLNISADSNYAAYVNGTLAAFGQYADFPHDKVYDSVDISKYCKSGKNSLAIIVWYYGIETTAVYCLGNAALCFEVLNGDSVAAFSGKHTLSRKSLSYTSHSKKTITSQLGFSFEYDSNKQDDWLAGKLNGFCKSTVVDQNLPLRIRPNKKLELLPTVNAKQIKVLSDTELLFDLGEEYTGFLYLDFECDTAQNLRLRYDNGTCGGCRYAHRLFCCKRCIGDTAVCACLCRRYHAVCD